LLASLVLLSALCQLLPQERQFLGPLGCCETPPLLICADLGQLLGWVVALAALHILGFVAGAGGLVEDLTEIAEVEPGGCGVESNAKEELTAVAGRPQAGVSEEQDLCGVGLGGAAESEEGLSVAVSRLLGPFAAVRLGGEGEAGGTIEVVGHTSYTVVEETTLGSVSAAVDTILMRAELRGLGGLGLGASSAVNIGRVVTGVSAVADLIVEEQTVGTLLLCVHTLATLPVAVTVLAVGVVLGAFGRAAVLGGNSRDQCR